MNLRADRYLKSDLRKMYAIPMKGGPIFYAGRFGSINIRELTQNKIEQLLDRGATFIHRRQYIDEEE